MSNANAAYTTADNNIRNLNRALDALRLSIEALDDMAGSGDEDAMETRTDMETAMARTVALIRRETARRDAAELAQRAAAE